MWTRSCKLVSCSALLALIFLVPSGSRAQMQTCPPDQVFDYMHAMVVGNPFDPTDRLEIDVSNFESDAVQLSYNTLSRSATADNESTENRETDYFRILGSEVLQVGETRTFEVSALPTSHPLDHSDLEIFAREVAYMDWEEFDHGRLGAEGDLDRTFDQLGYSYPEIGYRVYRAFGDGGPLATGFEAFLLTSEELLELIVRVEDLSSPSRCLRIEHHRITIYDLDKPPVLAVRGTRDLPEDAWSDLDPASPGYDQFQANRHAVTDAFEEVSQPEGSDGQVLFNRLQYPPSITGHSLGGAVAQWLGAYYSGIGGYMKNIVSFNAPGIGSDGTASMNASRVETVTHYVTSADLISMAGFDYLEGGRLSFTNNSFPNWRLSSFPSQDFSATMLLEKHGTPVVAPHIYSSGLSRPQSLGVKEYESVGEIDLPFEESPNINDTSLADTCFTYLPDTDYILWQLSIAKMVARFAGPRIGANVGLALTFRGTVEDARQELSKSLYPRGQWYQYLDLSNGFQKTIAGLASLTERGAFLRALSKILTVRPTGHMCFEELNDSGRPESATAQFSEEKPDSSPPTPAPSPSPSSNANPNAADHLWQAMLGWNSFILDDLEFWLAPVEAFEAMLFWSDEQWATFDWNEARDMTAEEWLRTVVGLKISGTVWSDMNGNGLREEDESGRGGQLIFLDQAPYNGSPDSGEPTAVTTGSGSYEFFGVAAETYRVTQNLNTRQGWQLTAPAAGWHEVVGDPRDPSAVFSGLDFGNLCPTGALCDDPGGNTSDVIEINDQMFLQTFRHVGEGLVDMDTGVSSSEWVCGLVGLQSSRGDINENTRGDIIQTYLYRSGGTWRALADFRSHDFHEAWHRLDILCIDASLVADGGPAPGKLFFLREYDGLGDDVRLNTGVSASSWDCSVVGFAALDGNINPRGRSHIMSAYPYISSGTWHLRGEFRTESWNHESWKMNMLCTDSKIVGRGLSAPEKPMMTKKFVGIQGGAGLDTGIPTDDWVCGLSGLKIDDGDIFEHSSNHQSIIEAYLFSDGGSWQADLDFINEGSEETWDIDVLCHRRGLPTQVGNPPGVPLNLSASAGDGSTSLFWNPPLDDGGYPIVRYDYEVRAAGGSTSSGTATSATVGLDGLTNGMVHFARVRAVNAAGDGGWTPEVSFTPVTGGTVTATPYFEPGYKVGLRATWTAVSGAAEYRVIHFRQDDCGSWTSTITTTDLVSASGLHPNCGAPTSCYLKRVTVEALNSGGVLSSDTASFCEVGPPPLPDIPRNFTVVADEGQVSLNWDPPQSSLVDHYEYSVREIDEIPGPSWTTTSTSATRTGLINGVPYFAKARAVNSAGAGDWTEELQVTPGSPAALAVTSTPYFAPGYEVGLTAQWSSFPGASNYRVTHYRQDACGSSSVVTTTTGLSSSSGLHPNCGAPNGCYFKEATVEALDSSGGVLAVGSDSFCEVGEPPTTAPSVPRNLIATGGDGTIALDWSPPSDDGGAPITSYVYSIRIYNNSGPSWSTASTSVQRGGFNNGTLYYAKVKARNSVGDSSWTAEVQVVPEAPPVLEVTATPYFVPGYEVGLSASWDAFPGASNYRVTHYRQDACGSSSVVTTTTGLSSGSGLHPNCGAPNGCYFKEATVEALDSGGGVLATASDSFCEVGDPPLTAPTVPRSLTATGGDGSISLNWLPSADDGGASITSYIYSIRIYNNSGQSWTSHGTSVTRGGFANDTLYYAKVKARNSLGDSPWTAEVPVRPQGPELSVQVTPYFGSGYRVGLSASWDAFPGAVEYRVRNFRQDSCGSASSTVTVTGTSTGSGLHTNCGAPGSCYFREVTVEALNASGAVLDSATGSFCEVGNP